MVMAIGEIAEKYQNLNIQSKNMRVGCNTDFPLKNELNTLIKSYKNVLFKDLNYSEILKNLEDKHGELIYQIRQNNDRKALKRLEDYLDFDKQSIEATREYYKNEKRKKLNGHYYASNMTEEESKYNFETVIVKAEEEQEMFEKFKTYVEKFEQIKKHGFGFIFSGKAGTGKTFYALSIANELFKKEYAIRRINTTNFLNKVKETYNKLKKPENVQTENVQTENKIFEKLFDADFLIIDDLGNDKMSEWLQEKMFLLFDELYRRKIPFIITTNLTGQQLEEYLQINGSNKITSRIRARTKMFLFDWEDRRQENKNLFDDILNG